MIVIGTQIFFKYMLSLSYHHSELLYAAMGGVLCKVVPQTHDMAIMEHQTRFQRTNPFIYILRKHPKLQIEYQLTQTLHTRLRPNKPTNIVCMHCNSDVLSSSSLEVPAALTESQRLV